MIKAACQTIVYGRGRIKDDIAAIAKNAAQNGYDGLEIGADYFYMDKPEYYERVFCENNLVLAAIHYGGNLQDRESFPSLLEKIGATIRFAAQLRCRNIYISGNNMKDKPEDDYRREAAALAEIGESCAAQGIALCYHNHFWEIKNDCRELEYLVQHVPSDCMKLVPDVGWVQAGGMDPVAFLKRYRQRIHAVHFKDFARYGEPWAFTEIGRGIVGFKAICAYLKDSLKDNPGDFWITAEQDETDKPPEASAKINRETIRELMS
jgi:sugar phosphate isomerase/epimerase